jgi:type IV secretion system protein VirB6
MSACGSVDPRAVVASLIGVADCQAAALGSDGWRALATSPLFTGVLTGLLMIAVAWHGYRLLAVGAGGTLLPVDAVALLVRIGIVVALTTSWSAYDRLIYRVATEGPAEIAQATFPAAGIETAALATRLQNAYDAIEVTPEEKLARMTAAQGTEARPAVNPELSASAGPSGSDRNAAATVLLISGAGSWIAARFATALLLALGPIAIAAMLFETTAGLCIGWLRALIGTALAGLVIPLALALELQMIEGPVRAALRAGSEEIPGLAPIVWSFVLVIAALVFVAQRMAGGIRLPRLRIAPRAPAEAAIPPAVAKPTPSPGDRTITLTPVSAPSRALAIARAAEMRSERGRDIAVSVGAAAANRNVTVDMPRPSRGNVLATDAGRLTAGRRTIGSEQLRTA